MSRKTVISNKKIFEEALYSLKPENLLQSLKFDKVSQTLHVEKDRKFLLKNGYYLVGFGKAVLGIAATLVSKLQDGPVLKGGLLSIPSGTSDLPNFTNWIEACKKQNVEIFEGAYNNLPDENSEKAAKAVVDMVSNLDKEDVVIVLISGGGSALLSMTIPGLKLDDKLDVIKLLSRAGADIVELNTVRKALSFVKGGKLSQIIAPAQVISLVISDIIGDPLNMIASGPTVQCNDRGEPLKILEKYKLLDKIPESVLNVLKHVAVDSSQRKVIDNTNNFLIGTNLIPLNFIHENFRKQFNDCFMIGRRIKGEAREVGTLLADLVSSFCQQNEFDLISHLRGFGMEDDHEIGRIINSQAQFGKENCGSIFLCAGGETTVTVAGNGKGGRNQELVLSFALRITNIQEELRKQGYFIEVLSCGTDGIDGPTTAAGAVWNTEKNLAKEAFDHIMNNDSYNFWRKHDDECLVKTGHTGTNVADIILCQILKF